MAHQRPIQTNRLPDGTFLMNKNTKHVEIDRHINACFESGVFIGFGTVCWLDVKEYEAIQPDKIAVDGGEQNLKELNAMFSKPVKEILSTETEIDDAAFISIDSKGTDIRVRRGAQFNIQRLSFESESGVETLDEAKKALQRIIDRGHKSIFITKS